jgi:hypothetical protein
MMLLTFIQLFLFGALLTPRRGPFSAALATALARTVPAKAAVRSFALRWAPPGGQGWMPSKS